MPSTPRNGQLYTVITNRSVFTGIYCRVSKVFGHGDIRVPLADVESWTRKLHEWQEIVIEDHPFQDDLVHITQDTQAERDVYKYDSIMGYYVSMVNNYCVIKADSVVAWRRIDIPDDYAG